MTNLKEIEKIANELGNDLERVNRELKRISSAKTRLKKNKFKSTYETEMTKLLQEEQTMKEVKQLICPKDKPVTKFEQIDIDLLDYDETIKAIKSIQSKMTLTRWLTPIEGDNDEFREAFKIYEMLKEHKNQIKPIEDTTVRKSDLMTIIETIESNKDLSQERIVELLKNLI